MSKLIDLTGKRFGRLLVLRRVGIKNSSATWLCRCDCGREVEVKAVAMLHKGTVSCGCNRREKMRGNLAGTPAEKLGQVEGTNASKLRGTEAQANNKSGYKGVSWHKNGHGGGAWVAVIYFKGTRYRLGFFSTPQEASKAYLAAKAQIHGDFLAWYDARNNEGT